MLSLPSLVSAENMKRFLANAEQFEPKEGVHDSSFAKYYHHLEEELVLKSSGAPRHQYKDNPFKDAGEERPDPAGYFVESEGVYYYSLITQKPDTFKSKKWGKKNVGKPKDRFKQDIVHMNWDTAGYYDKKEGLRFDVLVHNHTKPPKNYNKKKHAIFDRFSRPLKNPESLAKEDPSTYYEPPTAVVQFVLDDFAEKEREENEEVTKEYHEPKTKKIDKLLLYSP